MLMPAVILASQAFWEIEVFSPVPKRVLYDVRDHDVIVDVEDWWTDSHDDESFRTEVEG